MIPLSEQEKDILGISAKDEALKRKFRELPCLACGANPPSVVHHIKTRKSGGRDYEWNLMPLCIRHHNEVHKMGSVSFVRKHEHIWFDYLKPLGWEILSLGKIEKLFHERNK